MIILIAAMAENRVIGDANSLPWHLPEDMKHFRETTRGNTVIMGRKTYESLPDKYRPLPNRNNIVLSTTMPETEGVVVCRSIDAALEAAGAFECDAYVIGGESVYRQFLPLADQMIITHVHGEYEGDVRFPEWGDEWEEKERKEFEKFDIVVYEC